MAKRNRLQELFEVDRLLEPDGMAETERAELPEISTTDLSTTERATPAELPPAEPAIPPASRPGGRTRRLDARLELADGADTPVPLSSIEVTRERTIGFDDELHEQSTEGGLEYQRRARALDTPRVENTAPRAVELDAHGSAEKTAPRRTSAAPPAGWEQGAPPSAVASGLAKQAALVSLAALLLGLVIGVLVRAPSPEAEVVSRERPRGPETTPPAVQPRVELSGHVEASPKIESSETAEVELGRAPEASAPADAGPDASRNARTSRSRRRSAAKVAPASATPAPVDPMVELEARFRPLEKRHRRMLRKRSLARRDLARLGVSSEVTSKWSQARAAKDAELGEAALLELETALGQVSIDRAFLEYRLKRVLARTKAWASKHPDDVTTARDWETKYFELRKALLHPSLAPNSRAATDLLARIDGLEREIDGASPR